MVRMFHSFNISNKLNRLNNTAFMIAMVIITFQNSSHKNKMKFYTNETLYDITELAFEDPLTRKEHCTSQ